MFMWSRGGCCNKINYVEQRFEKGVSVGFTDKYRQVFEGSSACCHTWCSQWDDWVVLLGTDGVAGGMVTIQRRWRPETKMSLNVVWLYVK